jgi:uncharacterized protein YbjQ (UPF0145 family)
VGVLSDKEVIVTTLEFLPGYRVKKVLGIVSGSTVRARNVGRDIVAAFRNLAGGEIVEYTELLASSRNEALSRMIEKAKALGANAVLGVRFATASIMSGVAEIVAYGTAVIVEPE